MSRQAPSPTRVLAARLLATLIEAVITLAVLVLALAIAAPLVGYSAALIWRAFEWGWRGLGL